MNRRTWFLVFLMIAVIFASLIVYFAGHTKRIRWFSQERAVFKGIISRIEFSLPANRADEADALMDSAWNEVERIGRIFNPFDERSEVARLNDRWKDGPIEISEDLAHVMAVAFEVSLATRGAFDITSWPLKLLWRQAANNGSEPTPESIANAVKKVGMHRVKLVGDRQVFFDVPDAGIDPGGIVKGYVVDRLSSLLKNAGVENGLVQCGGEISAWGESPMGEPWRIAIQDPEHDGVPWRIISHVGEIHISTSGDYEQKVKVGEREYNHIVDPRTGWPVDHKVASVTVLVESGPNANTRADALATALVVLGPSLGLECIENLRGVAALFLVRDDDRLIEIPSTRINYFFTAREGMP